MHNLVQHHHSQQRRLVVLSEMITSLEEYQAMAKNGLTRQASAAVAADILSMTRYMGFRDAPALEAHADLQTSFQHALGMEDAASISARIKMAIAKFKEWLISMYNTIRDQVGAMMVSFTKLRERVDSLKGMAKSIPDNSKTEVHIPANLAQQVSIQGDFGDGNFQQLQTVAKFGAITYPEAINEFFLELASVVKSYNPGESADSMVEAIEQSLAPLNFSNIDNNTYPGNVMITPDEGGFNYTIAAVEARQVEADVTRPVRNGIEIQRTLGEILKVIDIAEQIQGTSANIETSVNKVVEATDDLGKKTQDADEGQQQNASSMITAALSSTNKVSNSSANIIRYLGRVLNAHLQIIDHEIKVATTSQRA